jgi:2,4-dienoyl-CoA reductase-like NADH-dependent reductase (Old Yellow Enzyme family)
MSMISTPAEEGRGRAHGSVTDAVYDSEVPEIDLLSPIELRGVTLQSRIVMSPMCQYSAREGLANDWHLVHLGSRAVGGAALVMVEATAVTRDGRITPGDLGLWEDEHVRALGRIVRFVHDQGVVAGIQLAHAGRKGSCDVPWKGGARLGREQGGWPVVAPSPLPFLDGDPSPEPLDAAGIAAVEAAFEAAALRALVAGFRVFEIHAAHGYLIHEFLSPIANRRDDAYGGSLENRMRLLLNVAGRVRRVVPASLPLFVRISATDWVGGGWSVDDSVVLARRLFERGVDLVDVSSGGMVPKATIPVGSGYQVPFARRIREEAGIRTGAVGMICEPEQASQIITRGDADLVLLGRELLREPYWPQRAAHALDAEPRWPVQYGYALRRRLK